MAKAKIKGKPDKTVTWLTAPARGEGHVMSSSWTVPANMTKDSSTHRAEKLKVDWSVAMSTGVKVLSNTIGKSRTSSEINLDSFKIGNTTFTRSSFYPFTNNKLTNVVITVKGKNSKGAGKAAYVGSAFGAPRAPAISGISFDQSSGVCSATITTDAGADQLERYDTRYRITVRQRNGTTVTTANTASTSTEFGVSYDASDYMNLNPLRDEYIYVKVEAWARGYVGDSGVARREYYISYPAKPTITGLNVSSYDATGRLVVGVRTNATTQHPVDRVTLEYLANTTYEKASDIPNAASWSDCDIQDNGNCTALSIPLSISEHFVPDRGKFTWVRVKTMHAHEQTLVRYSDFTRVTAIETPPAAAAETDMKILSASGGDTDSALVQLAWNKTGTDDSTGTELSWSDEENTWKSTKEPERFEFTWSDGALYKKTEDVEIVSGKTYYTRSGEGTDEDPYVYTRVIVPSASRLDEYYEVEYHDSALITIKGLSEGVKYFIKARRYYDGETVSYGNYSDAATVIPNGKPAGVVASCKGEIPKGQPLQVYWTFGSTATQTEWQIVDSNGTVLANGKGGICGTQISAETLEAFAVNDTITFTVQVSTGSGFEISGEKTVKLVSRPTLDITAPSTLTAQPYSFTATTSKACDFMVIVTAQGASGQFPEGYKAQVKGDVLYSAYGKDLNVTELNGTYTITLPTGLDFWDMGKYTLYIIAIDRETGLKSDSIETTISVDWTHKAVDPDEFITLTPIDTVGEEDAHLQGVQIDLTPPTNSVATDVYDIYRMDGARAYLIGEGFPLTHTVIDEYAPFGDDELSYRIAIRTVDGDVQFAEKEYTLSSKTVRFDWEEGSLELPYGITIGDNYKKSVEFRQHMDGSVDGYWNQNIERGASYNSAIIKLIQPEEINLARLLARYAGAVFVRTANGSAFAADVQVTDLSVKNEAVTAIAIDATEVDMTEEFMLPTPFELEEEEEE